MNSVATYLLEPRFTQPEALRVTSAKPASIQTWVNRGVIKLVKQNPGRGKRRLYAPLDILKLAILSRTDDIGLPLSTARSIIAEAEDSLADVGAIEWDRYLYLHPRQDRLDRESGLTIIGPKGQRVPQFGVLVGDVYQQRVADVVEPDMATFRRRKRQHERPVDPEARDYWARQGIYAEPVVIFPLGEIINGTLAQLRALSEGAEQ